MWSIGRITLTRKNQNTRRKSWPSATLSTTNPIWTGLQVNPGVCDVMSRTNSQKHPPKVGEVTKKAFYCTDQSQCVVLNVGCVTNTGCVLCERVCNRNCHTAVVWSWRRMLNITVQYRATYDEFQCSTTITPQGKNFLSWNKTTFMTVPLLSIWSEVTFQ